jgi:hypothetical protein
MPVACELGNRSPLYNRTAVPPPRNIYFELTEAFNADGPAVVLAAGPAVVYYQIAIMSKDGDWIVRETAAACDQVLRVLSARGARYRPSAPLDVRWLAGGWSSHFEFRDERERRVRCDFFSRPPRVSAPALAALFTAPADGRLPVIGVEALIRMKQTQRSKDYAVIGELAPLLPAELELEPRIRIECSSSPPPLARTPTVLLCAPPFAATAVRRCWSPWRSKPTACDRSTRPGWSDSKGKARPICRSFAARGWQNCP